MSEEILITPEYLLSRDFIRGEDSEYVHDFDYPYSPDFGDLLFVQRELDRNMFAVILHAEQYEGEQPHDGKTYSGDAFIREDVGCGFVEIPSKFSTMTVKHFEMLYEAIHRKKLEMKTIVVQARDYSSSPKQIDL